MVKARDNVPHLWSGCWNGLSFWIKPMD
jgi:hypothetical protein